MQGIVVGIVVGFLLASVFYGIKQNPAVLNDLIDYQDPIVKQAVLEALGSTSILPRNAFTKIFDWVHDNIEYSYDSPLLVVVKDDVFSLEWKVDYWRSAIRRLKRVLQSLERLRRQLEP